MDRLLIASQINTFSWQRRRKSFFIDTSFTWFTWPTTKWKWRKLDFHTSKVGRNLHQFCCKVHHLVFLNNLVKITAEGILGTLNLKVLKTMMHPTSGPRKRAMISGSTWVLLSKKIVKSPFKSAVESWNAFRLQFSPVEESKETNVFTYFTWQRHTYHSVIDILVCFQTAILGRRRGFTLFQILIFGQKWNCRKIQKSVKKCCCFFKLGEVGFQNLGLKLKNCQNWIFGQKLDFLEQCDVQVGSHEW